ncbi:MAG: nucleotidyl transferase AbiEii/AbiGii toxin family protein [Nitrospinota bacterium]
MTEPRKYATATAFRRALEERLKQRAREEQVDLQRLRRQVAFDRLLARLFCQENAPWALKGGYAIELRIAHARTTKDIDLVLHDLRLLSDAEEDKRQAILDALQETTAIDLGDFFVFLIGLPARNLEGAPYGGVRYPVEARVDGRIFVKFHLDVGIGDVNMEPLDIVEGRDWLAFMGIPNPRFKMIPKEQQFAEKLHAYTLPREVAPNSRVKDLVDMVILINLGTMDREKLLWVIGATFSRRDTHPVPENLSEPPKEWEKPFAALARECKMNENMAEAFDFLNAFLSSLL